MNYQQFVCKKAPLPHYNQRKHPIEMLVIHSMAHSAEEGIHRLDELQLSTHYVVDYNGTIYNCVEEENRAWQAGISSWRGLSDINSRSIGIEVCHRTLGQSAFGNKQIKSLCLLCRQIIERWHISPEMIVGHSDIAPLRKPDPGKAFPWKALADENIGIWYGNNSSNEKNIAKMLSQIGYDTSSELAINASLYAFCRHFLPSKIKTMPVKLLLNHPYPNDCSYLFKDNDILCALQNIYAQYYVYK